MSIFIVNEHSFTMNCMSPRHRTTADTEILTAAMHVIGRLGPSRMTLADVAKEIGLAPATLMQRFGSKRGLLLAVSSHDTAGVSQCFAAARTAYKSPLDALLSAMAEVCQFVETPEQMSNSLAFLQIDLNDPEFHRLALENVRKVKSEIRLLLDAAVEAGELAPCDTDRLARAIQAVHSGSMVNWAIYREGTVAGCVRGNLETLLKPLRTRPRPHARSRKPAE